jgi:adenine-specific DNA-methyltransferase
MKSETATSQATMSGSNTVINGDCLAVLPTIPDASVDLVITDPPYLVSYRDRSGRSIANDDNANVLGAFSDLYRVLKPDTFCVSFYGWNRIDAFFRAWTEAGFRPVGHLVWHKG